MRESPDARLANLLGALATGLTDSVGDLAAAEGLDRTAATALVALQEFAPAGTVATLSQIVGLTHAGGVRLVDRLAGAGYVERTPGGDARSVSITLTRTGRNTARRIRQQRNAAITATMAGLTGRQRDQLTAACELLIANLTNRRLTQRARGIRPAGGALCRMCDFTACGRPTGHCPAATAATRAEPGSQSGRA